MCMFVEGWEGKLLVKVKERETGENVYVCGGVGGKATGEGKREGDRRECVCLWRGWEGESYW